MKSLDEIKQEYATRHHFSSWNHFCQVANDKRFIQAIDDIALQYARDTLSACLSYFENTYQIKKVTEGYSLQIH